MTMYWPSATQHSLPGPSSLLLPGITGAVACHEAAAPFPIRVFAATPYPDEYEHCTGALACLKKSFARMQVN